MKSAFVSIIGRPSSGKSTLINRICMNKVSIVSDVPQTTRNKVRGVYTSADGQLVFIDTPGYNISTKKFNNFLKNQAVTAMEESDILLYLVDATREAGDEEKTLIQIIKKSRRNRIIALNKTDREPNFIKEFSLLFSNELPGIAMLTISALTGKGVDGLVTLLFENSPEGEYYYPEDIYTDQLPEFRIREIIREKAISHTYEEVPHALYVHVEDMEMKDNGGYLWVRGFIFVEKDSQKGILIGKKGSKIRQILDEATEEINALFPYRVKLDFRVKVDAHWKSNDYLLKKMFTGQ
ncbi:MAG: GTPase Era [Spirochaetales bacterium]|nr:GTPase Era [Spirochaetales bacterium]